MTRKTFVRETREDLRSLSEDLIAVEEDAEDGALDRAFRRTHTLKSNFAMEGFDGASDLADALEDVLDCIRDDSLAPTLEVVDVALEGVDTLERIFEEVATGEHPETDPSQMTERLRDIARGANAQSTGGAPLNRSDTAGDDDPSGDTEDTEQSPEQPEEAKTGNERDESPTTSGDEQLPPLDEEGSGNNVSVEEALDRASRFDDLDSLVDEMDLDEGDIADLEGGGSFDDMDIEVGIEPQAASDEESPNPPEAAGPAAADDSRAEEPRSTFEELKAEVERSDPVQLDEELADVEFGEFDEDDELTVQELVDHEPSELPMEPTAPEVESADSFAADANNSSANEPAQVEEAERSPQGDEADSAPTDSGASTGSGPGKRLDPGSVRESVPDDPAAAFEELKAEVERSDPVQLDEELADVEFGEFDEDDELTVQELIGGEDSVKTGPLSGNREAPNIRRSRSATSGTPAEEAEGLPLQRDRDPVTFDTLSDGAADTAHTVSTITESDLDSSRFPGDPDLPDATERADSVRSVSVDTSTADELLTLVQELSIIRRGIESAVDRGDIDDVRRSLSSLSSVADDLRRTVTDVRLMSLEQATRRLSRVARDAAREAGKEVDLSIECEEIQLDRSIVDRIGDPLVHLVRNAVDHGIEPPGERKQAGKSREGRVVVRAERHRDHVTVSVEDDGRGIDPDAVLAQAVEQGLVSEEEAATLDRQETYDMLFRPGFSTRDEVTAVSGRGVGMDVVGRTVAELDGSVEIDSRSGAGTTVRMRLPVSVAMGETLLVASGDERFGLPMSVVDSVKRVGATDDRETEPAPDREIISLAETFEPPSATPAAEEVLITIQPDVRPVTIRCSGVGEKRETVTIPYEGLLAGISGVSGAALAADGRLVNIIDIETI